jgi:hypothetical protein
MIILTLCVACGDDNPDHLHQHHLVPRSCGGTDDESNLITLCVACHGKVHGVEWSNDHSERIKDGIARAQAQGKPYGRPGIPEGTRQAIQDAYRAGNVGMRVVGAQFGVSAETVRRCLA